MKYQIKICNKAYAKSAHRVYLKLKLKAIRSENIFTPAAPFGFVLVDNNNLLKPAPLPIYRPIDLDEERV